MDDFESWYAILQDLANLHGENVSDRDVWYEDFETGKNNPSFNENEEFMGNASIHALIKLNSAIMSRLATEPEDFLESMIHFATFLIEDAQNKTGLKIMKAESSNSNSNSVH